MANMSYCAGENTLNNMAQLVQLIQERGSLASFLKKANMHERNAWPELVELAKLIVEVADAEEFVDDEDYDDLDDES